MSKFRPLWGLLAVCFVLLLSACEQRPQYDNVIDVNADQAAQILVTQDVQVLDIRTAQEFSGRKIPGALNIDFYKRDFKSRLDQLDRNQAYLVYCHSGSRTAQAMGLFHQMGFKKIYHLSRGLVGGLPQVP